MRAPLVTISLILSLAGPFATGCRDADLEARVQSLEAQLLFMDVPTKEGESEPPSPAATPDDEPRGSPDGCIGDMRPVERTIRFLVQVEALMEDYVASNVDVTDELSCVTEAQLFGNPALRRRVQRAVDKNRGAASARGYQVAYTWASDLSRYRNNRFGCHAFEPESREYKWTAGIGSAAACADHQRTLRKETPKATATWRLRTAATTYSDGPPELMRRMQKAGLAAPTTVACMVADVRKRGEIECQGSDGIIYAIDPGKGASAFTSALNRGDIVGAKGIGEMRRASPAEPWTFGEVPADGLTVLEQSRCCLARDESSSDR